MESGFESVYPFATENVLEYFATLNLKDQSVLTVGSSLDQLFNALVYGAKKVSVFDINPYRNLNTFRNEKTFKPL